VKALAQLLEVSKENLPSIYCDLDMVLVNFIKGADAAVGGSFVDTPKDERWSKVNQVKGFWENLEWMPGAKRLYQFIARYDAHVLSAYTDRDPTSRVGKMKWLAKNTDFKRSNINLVLRSQKQKNIREWEAQGGIGILHTKVSETINELKRLGFK
jgi:5'(3')-deoxyribonucleotidase